MSRRPVEILNVAPDAGCRPHRSTRCSTFLGQFFDHGLDLANKQGGDKYVPLMPDDPLGHAELEPTNFMVLKPGPRQILRSRTGPRYGPIAGAMAMTETTPFVKPEPRPTRITSSHRCSCVSYATGRDGRHRRVA